MLRTLKEQTHHNTDPCWHPARPGCPGCPAHPHAADSKRTNTPQHWSILTPCTPWVPWVPCTLSCCGLLKNKHTTSLVRHTAELEAGKPSFRLDFSPSHWPHIHAECTAETFPAKECLSSQHYSPGHFWYNFCGTVKSLKQWLVSSEWRLFLPVVANNLAAWWIVL